MALNECWCWKTCKDGTKHEAGHCGTYPNDCSCCDNFPDPCESGAVGSYTKPFKRKASSMRSASGVSEKEVGRTMAIWAYAGVFAGTLALYKYMDLMGRDKKKLLLGYGIVFAGLALGSAVGSYRVEQKRD